MQTSYCFIRVPTTAERATNSKAVSMATLRMNVVNHQCTDAHIVKKDVH